MTTSNIDSIIAVSVSLLSLIASLINNFKQKKYIKTQDELNKILLDKEKKEILLEKRASVSSNVIKLGSSKYRIKVYNNGKSKAENVNIKFIDDPDWMVMNDLFPLEFLDCGKSAEIGLSIFMGSKRKAKTLITWEDSEGSNEKEVLLTI